MSDDVETLREALYDAKDGPQHVFIAALDRLAARLEDAEEKVRWLGPTNEIAEVKARLEATEAALNAARPFAQYANNREGGMGVLLTDIQAKLRAALAALDKETQGCVCTSAKQHRMGYCHDR